MAAIFFCSLRAVLIPFLFVNKCLGAPPTKIQTEALRWLFRAVLISFLYL